MKSLCAPTPELSCFGCCPPIRPAHYDPLDYTGSLRREFVENRRSFFKQGPIRKPVMGYYCWALGFLDAKGRKVGCLLHPHQNQGQDLRSLIDYGTKCQRESCSAARMFALLPLEGQGFWLPLVQGMNSFYFSSPRSNPLFHLLLWGPEVLEPLRQWAERLGWTSTELLYRQPFLLDSLWKPQAHRYFFRLLLEWVSLNHEADRALHKLSHEFPCHVLSWAQTQRVLEVDSESIFTHLLPLSADFLDFLRLGLGWGKASLQQAIEIDKQARQMVGDLMISHVRDAIAFTS